jgi:protein tyrosine phosphatase (PTP) superfamily phosphohydrolase (DUF442 family)
MNNNELPGYFKIDETFATGAQPTAEGLVQLKENGYTAVVNLSPTSTPNYLPKEGEITEDLDMAYVHYPVDCSNLQDRHYKVFSKILKGLDGEQVFIHCGGNIKSSNLMHMYRVIERHEDAKNSFDDLLKIQNPEDTWFDYFKRFGMAV